jgi:hypothetical protein
MVIGVVSLILWALIIIVTLKGASGARHSHVPDWQCPGIVPFRRHKIAQGRGSRGFSHGVGQTEPLGVAVGRAAYPHNCGRSAYFGSALGRGRSEGAIKHHILTIGGDITA